MPNDPLRIAVFGASGRMGAQVLAASAGRVEVGLALVRPDSPDLGRACPGGSPARGGVIRFEGASTAAWDGIGAVVDFSSPDGLREAITYCGRYRIALVSGTTPCAPELDRSLDDLALRVPVLHAPNFSRGLWALAKMIPGFRSWLGASFEAGLLDIHHAAKKDAPSGTARALAAAWGSGQSERTASASLRLGQAVGDHALWIEGTGERIEIWHRVRDRRVFAEGALDAALALAARPPGRYTLDSLWEPSGGSCL
jgi:4-hydroxy-tetrahydrodipicolinate reductase